MDWVRMADEPFEVVAIYLSPVSGTQLDCPLPALGNLWESVAVMY
jgi:hypothetical protein